MVVKVSLLSGAVASDGVLSIQTNGTTEAISISTGQVATFVNNPILSGGQINGVAYLNTSKILTTGTGLVFDGTNLGVGTPSPTQKLHIAISSASTIYHRIQNSAGDCYLGLSAAGNTELSADNTGNQLIFKTVAVERARIDSSGNLLVGTTSAAAGAASTFQISATGTSTAAFVCTHASSPNGILISYPNAAPNNTANEFWYCKDTGAAPRASMRSNGGLANYSANNVNLSDERTKTDIQNAGSYLAKICAIPVRTFKYKDQTDDLLNLGVIAQEVETVAPELVDASGFGETPEDGVPLKAIYQTDLQFALMKCIQELKAEFEEYKAAHP